LTGWKWDFGDKFTSILQNPEHLYRNPGKIPVSLTVRDTNKCVEKVTKTINYFPVPNLIVVSPSASQGCVPLKIKFTNLSFPIDSTYKILWKFGDGGSAKAISPTYTYNDPGVFTVSLDITSPIGCKTDTIFKDLIKVRPSPKAGFTIDPPEATNLTELINLFDESQGAIRWNWQLSNGRNFTERSPRFSPPDTGRINVRQIVTNSVNCLDTLDKILNIRPEVRYFLPNAFTPNGDSVNDEFKGVGVMAGAKSFNFTIWNRWGELIYQTDSPNKGWNGRKFNAGVESPPGVYVVLVTYRDPRGNPYELKGFVTLIR
jgi:gliding motility-associated-like protein